MKPPWLNKKISLKDCSSVKRTLRDLCVETVCEQALCPNMGECFSRGQATFLILGRHCTRFCRFCNVEKGLPLALDASEPGHVADAVARLGLKHVVVTSVTRDDLFDGGAGVFAQTVLAIREKSSAVRIEILIPDFMVSYKALETVARVGADIIAHNVETVPSLYREVRQGADYLRSLSVLRIIKELSPACKTKSGIMLGLGEKVEEVFSVMADLRSVGCDFLSIGQYLAPSQKHYPVQEYVLPERFERIKAKGLEKGFLHIESGPYVRSSYMAEAYCP